MVVWYSNIVPINHDACYWLFLRLNVIAYVLYIYMYAVWVDRYISSINLLFNYYMNSFKTTRTNNTSWLIFFFGGGGEKRTTTSLNSFFSITILLSQYNILFERYIFNILLTYINRFVLFPMMYLRCTSVSNYYTVMFYVIIIIFISL